MQNNIKQKYHQTLKRTFSSIEENEDMITFLKILYKSCNFHSFSIGDVNSLLFMEGRRSLYQNIVLPFISSDLRKKVEID